MFKDFSKKRTTWGDEKVFSQILIPCLIVSIILDVLACIFLMANGFNFNNYPIWIIIYALNCLTLLTYGMCLSMYLIYYLIRFLLYFFQVWKNNKGGNVSEKFIIT